MTERLAYIIAAAVLPLATAVSCSRSFREEPERGCIQFNVAVAATTKVHDAGALTHPEDGVIGVWAYSFPSSEGWRDASGTASPEMEDEKVVHFDGHIWRPEEERLWAGGGRSMKFFAYSPHGRGGYDKDAGIRFDAYSLSEGEDLMFCETADLDYGSSLGTVKLAFTRALCRVEFRLLSSLRSDTELTVRKLTLGGVHTGGDFRSLPLPGWTVSGPAEDFLFFDGELADAGNAGHICGAYMIPQSGTLRVELTCDLATGGSALDGQLFGTELQADWEPGRQYLYLLKLGRDMKLTIEKDIYDNYE